MEIRSLVEEIEAYLKKLLRNSPEGQIEVQRKEIAARFSCVPSQVTYVINTRFNTRYGYYVESRRGGGGFIRISNLHTLLVQEPKNGVSSQVPDANDGTADYRDFGEEFRNILYALTRRRLLTEREFSLLHTVFRVLEENISVEDSYDLGLRILREFLSR